MKYNELISRLQTEPNDQLFAEAQRILEGKTSLSKPLQEMAKILVRSAETKEEFEWLSSCLKDKDSEIPAWAASNIITVDVHDWLLQFAVENPNNRQAGKLWEALLREMSPLVFQWLSKHRRLGS